MRKYCNAVLRHKFLYMLLLIPMAYFVIFKFWPMFYVIIAFKDYNLFEGLAASPWVGFKHFIDFFTGPDFSIVLFNSFCINFIHLVFGFPAPIILALMLNEIMSNKLKRTFQTITYMPYFISMVVVVGIVQSFLSTTGPVNAILSSLGYETVFFMGKVDYFRSIYVSSIIWQQTGWLSIIYLAALAGVDVQLYEAAIVDGAGKWKQLIHITIPSISNTIIVMLVLRLGDMLNVYFERMYLMSNSATREVSEVNRHN